MLLFGADTALCRSFSRLLFPEDISRTAERSVGCNGGRASLPRRTSGAHSPAKNEWPGSRRRRLSDSATGRIVLRGNFAPISSFLLFLGIMEEAIADPIAALSSCGDVKQTRRVPTCVAVTGSAAATNADEHVVGPYEDSGITATRYSSDVGSVASLSLPRDMWSTKKWADGEPWPMKCEGQKPPEGNSRCGGPWEETAKCTNCRQYDDILSIGKVIYRAVHYAFPAALHKAGSVDPLQVSCERCRSDVPRQPSIDANNNYN
jgi:hypothetical protein